MSGILFFDTETTGFQKSELAKDDPAQPHIVQLAAILTDNTGAVEQEYCTIVRPTDWTVPPDAERIHGISTEKARAAGIPIEDALQAFSELASRAEVVVAHNLEFDQFLLEIECARARLPVPIAALAKRCTMKGTTALVRIPHPKRPGDFKWPSLMEAHRFFVGTSFEGAHDAMADARACAAIYFKCRESMTV